MAYFTGDLTDKEVESLIELALSVLIERNMIPFRVAPEDLATCAPQVEEIQ